MYKRPLTLTLICDDVNRPEANLINEASVKLVLTPSKDFLELVTGLEFTRRGKMSWSLSTRNNGRKISKFFGEYLNNFLPTTMVQGKNDVDAHNVFAKYNFETVVTEYNYRDSIRDALAEIPDYVRPQINAFSTEFVQDMRIFSSNRRRTPDFMPRYATLGGVHVEIKNDQLWVRLFPVKTLEEWSTSGGIHRIHLPKVRNVQQSVETYYPPRKISIFMEEIRAVWGDCFETVEDNAVTRLLDRAKEVVTVGYSPNQPATVLLCVGDKAYTPNLRQRATNKLNSYKVNTEYKVPLSTALKLQDANKNVEFLIHPALNDVVRMSKAKAYNADKRLKDFQKKAVGLHLSTDIGYLQTCSPGLGKTVIQLSGMRARSEKIVNYRGIVVCEANVREQWAEEAAKWFPEAKLCVIRSHGDTENLIDALSFEGPSVIIMSYAHTLLSHTERDERAEYAKKLKLMTYAQKLHAMQNEPIPDLTIGSLILDTLWDDICADEAVSIRNGSSKQFSIMWTLRQNSQVAVPLTASPVNKSPDDIGRLLAWARNDKNMFTGAPLSEQYDTSTEEGAMQLFKVFGPLVFRRDTSEIADELPNVTQQVQLLTPSAGEKALSFAAENELKRCYLELVAALDEAGKADNADKDELEKVKANLESARGAWLGGTQLARMATSDPTALLQSNSVGAALLVGQGLVDAALSTEPTKRKKLVEDMLVRVQKGQQVIIFTEFATVAETLAAALKENGLNAKTYTGKNGSTRDRSRKDFQEGNIDILVCTQAAERGLTLHKASAIVLYDLPWVPDKIIQRIGRGVRIGSTNIDFEVVFMIMEGTIEHRIANRLSELGMSASLILDHSRGVDIKKTEIASAMGGLMKTMAASGNNKNLEHFAELLGIAA